MASFPATPRLKVVASARSGMRHPVAGFLVRRVLAGIVTLWVASILIFGALYILPGDVASVVLGRNASPEAVETVRKQLNLDDPLVSRYLDWLGNTVTGDFGVSTTRAAAGDPDAAVWPAIRTPLLNSFVLAGLTVLIVIPASLLLGTLAAMRAQKPIDHAISTTALAFGAIPEFLTGSLLIALFFVQLGWLPPLALLGPGQNPFSEPDRLVLPVATLVAFTLAYGVRLVRASTIEVLRQDYVRMARLNGFSERTVVWRFVVRNALAPSVQGFALTTQYLIGGIIITENVFAYPGIGSVLVQAVAVRDVQIVSVIATILAAAYICVNIVADLIVMLTVPKLRTQAR